MDYCTAAWRGIEMGNRRVAKIGIPRNERAKWSTVLFGVDREATPPSGQKGKIGTGSLARLH